MTDRYDRDQVREFLEALHGTDELDDGQIELRFLREGRKAEPYFARSVAEALAHVEKHARPGVNVYVGVALREADATQGRKEDCRSVRWLWADLDAEEGETPKDLAARVVAFVERTNRRPHMGVCSGNGMHVYWQLAEPVDLTDPAAVEALEETVAGLALALRGDIAVRDCSRIMRVAGTTNYPDAKKRKRGRGVVPSTLEGVNDALPPYRLEDFADVRALAQEHGKKGRPRSGERVDPGAELPESVAALLEHDEFVRRRYARNGEGLGDASQSGIDCSLAALLWRRDVEEADILTALHRSRVEHGIPGERRDYYARTVAKTRPQENARDEYAPPPPRPWPTLDPAAYRGLAGEFVALVEPHSEADPVALLVQFLAAFGSAVGRGPYFQVEGDRHGTSLYVAIVGETAGGRKGTSLGRVRAVFKLADEDWARQRVTGGLSSGEGLLYEIRDPIERNERVHTGKGEPIRYELVQVDAGVEDKRLLVIEPELARVFGAMAREGNTLSAILRELWDGSSEAVRTLTKSSPLRASGAHVSIIGHITRNELLRHVGATEAGNGFANRFLWLRVQRSKLLPDGGALQEEELAELGRNVQKALFAARQVGRMQRSDDARKLWHAVYRELTEGRPGLLGSVLARGAAQVLRLSEIYALLDGKGGTIERAHLEAALALWRYCEASAEGIFGDALGDPVADEILRALRAAGRRGLTRTEIRDLFGRHASVARLSQALGLLLERQLARCVKEDTGGRPAERWFSCSDGGDQSVRSDQRPPDADPDRDAEGFGRFHRFSRPPESEPAEQAERQEAGR